MSKIVRPNLVSYLLLRSSAAALLLAVLVTGCANGGDVATSVRRPAGQRPDVDAKAATGTLAIPAGKAFNITSFKSGQEGNARGEAKAAGTDGAQCSAEASAGGTAWAEFQLGYCFDNTSGMPLHAAVTLHLTLAASQDDKAASLSATPAASQSVGVSAPDSPAVDSQTSTATTTLTYFVKDTNGMLLRQESLVAMDLERGPQSAKDEPTRVFDLQLPPDRGCYLVIAGHTDVRSGSRQTAAAGLEVQRCSLEIAWQPQPSGQPSTQPVPLPPGEKSPGS